MRFTEDNLLNEIVGKVKKAIDSGLIEKSDGDDKLKSLIQYELSKYVSSRQDALTILKHISFDEKMWDKMISQVGDFKSLKDIALADLWIYLQKEGALTFEYYE